MNIPSFEEFLAPKADDYPGEIVRRYFDSERGFDLRTPDGVGEFASYLTVTTSRAFLSILADYHQWLSREISRQV